MSRLTPQERRDAVDACPELIRYWRGRFNKGKGQLELMIAEALLDAEEEIAALRRSPSDREGGE